MLTEHINVFFFFFFFYVLFKLFLFEDLGYD